jgi:phage recombination protein Bet
MNQAVATIDRPARSVLVDMATRYNMEPAAFEATVRATCIKPDKNGRVASREEFAAFLLVAKEYKLNPLTKEIYAYASKGGGIVPIVSVDGWVNLVNSHGACDGFEFDMEHDEKKVLVSCTCRMYRKDRSKPVSVTEYLSECIRDTEPWKMKHRMLRHKAMIQAARYAFGFSGIYDEDEGEKIAEMRDVTPQRDEPPTPPAPPQITSTQTVAAPAIQPAQEVIPPAAKKEDVPNPGEDPEAFIKFVTAKLTAATTGEHLNEVWDLYITPAEKELFPTDQDDLMSVYRKREAELS